MATTFFDNLKNTYNKLVDDAVLHPSNKSPKAYSNDIIDYFQYANEGDAKDTMKFQQRNKADLQYTPFAWSGGRGTIYAGNSTELVPSSEAITGLVISGPSPTGEGTRILGVELDDGRSFNAMGAKQFFEGMRNKGSFKFADQAQLWDNKKAGDWPLQSGNPFIFVDENKTIDNSGMKTFKGGKNAGYQEIRDARSFLNNLRNMRRY